MADYVYLPPPGAYDEAVPVTVQRVNSAITQPADEAWVPPGLLVVRGAAWGGAEPLQRVEVSRDGGWNGRRRHGLARRCPVPGGSGSSSPRRFHRAAM